MATHGLLKKVWDNEKNFGLVIEVDDHGEHKFNLWKWELAGKPSESNPEPICDCHEFVDKRIVYTAKRGGLKDKSGPDDGDRWPSTIEDIALETSSELTDEVAPEIEREASVVDSPSNHEQVVAKYNTERLSRLALEAVQADLRAHEARAAWLDEVTRLAS